MKSKHSYLPFEYDSKLFESFISIKFLEDFGPVSKGEEFRSGEVSGNTVWLRRRTDPFQETSKSETLTINFQITSVKAI